MTLKIRPSSSKTICFARRRTPVTTRPRTSSTVGDTVRSTKGLARRTSRNVSPVTRRSRWSMYTVRSGSSGIRWHRSRALAGQSYTAWQAPWIAKGGALAPTPTRPGLRRTGRAIPLSGKGVTGACSAAHFEEHFVSECQAGPRGAAVDPAAGKPAPVAGTRSRQQNGPGRTGRRLDWFGESWSGLPPVRRESDMCRIQIQPDTDTAGYRYSPNGRDAVTFR